MALRKAALAVGFVLLAVGLGPLAKASLGADPPRQILVFAAASTTNALDEIRQTFARETGVEVQVSYASSATLAQQILHGAEADLFLSADPQWVDHLAKNDLVAQRGNLLGNHLVIIVPAASRLELKRPEDLLGRAIDNVAMGDPQGTPAGKYTRQALEKLGLWDRLRWKIVPGADVRQALSFVETGAAEAGIVYATDAAASRKVRPAAEIPMSHAEPIRYPLALLKSGHHKNAALRFYQYLSSPPASRVFQKHGFVVLAGAAAKED